MPGHYYLMKCQCGIKAKSQLTQRAPGRLDSHRFLDLFVALGFVRFVGESRPSSRR